MASMRSASTNTRKLVLGADWACAHGDAGGLGDVARRLSELAPASFRSALQKICQVANSPAGDPFARWASVRPALVEYLRDDASGDRGESITRTET